MTPIINASCAADIAASVLHLVPDADRAIAEAAIAATRAGVAVNCLAPRAAATEAAVRLAESGLPRASAAMAVAASAAKLAIFTSRPGGEDHANAIVRSIRFSLQAALS